MHDNDKGTCVLTDVTIYGDRNVIKRDDMKIRKYKDLKTEIQHMWNIKTKVILVTLGATGTISIPEQHTGKDKIKELQKKAILDTAHLLQEVLM
jgi:hypothetical protein